MTTWRHPMEAIKSLKLSKNVVPLEPAVIRFILYAPIQCSIEMKSGVLDGQRRTVIFCLCKISRVGQTVCGLALSCWNMAMLLKTHVAVCTTSSINRQNSLYMNQSGPVCIGYRCTWLFYHQPNLQPFGCSLLNQTVRQHCCGHTLWVWDHWSLFRWCCNVKTIPQTGLHALIPKSRNPLWTVLCISEIADAVDDAIIKHGRRWRSGICWRHA